MEQLRERLEPLVGRDIDFITHGGQNIYSGRMQAVELIEKDGLLFFKTSDGGLIPANESTSWWEVQYSGPTGNATS